MNLETTQFENMKEKLETLERINKVLCSKLQESIYSDCFYFGKIKRINGIPSIDESGRTIIIPIDEESEYESIIYMDENEVFDVNYPYAIINTTHGDELTSETPSVSDDNSTYLLDLDTLVRLDDVNREQGSSARGR